MIAYNIPVSRESYKNIVESINKIENTKCFMFFDFDRKLNQNIAKNKCIKQALGENFEYFGFADDDDEKVLDVVEIVKEELQTNDVIYFDNYENVGDKIFHKKFTGDVKRDINKSIEPWNIFFNKETVLKFFEKHGEWFDEKEPWFEGSKLMSKFVIDGYKIKHISTPCYVYNGINPIDSVGQRFKHLSKDAMKIINNNMNYKIFN